MIVERNSRGILYSVYVQLQETNCPKSKEKWSKQNFIIFFNFMS